MTLLSRLILVIPAILWLGGCGTTPAGARADQFFHGVTAGEVRSAMDVLPPELRKRVGDERLEVRLAQFSEQTRAAERSFTAEKVSIIGNTATVTYRVSDKGAPGTTLAVSMALIRGQWYISDTGLLRELSRTE